jgi:regulator of sirC expression with transglutaminase-like and TPR domain
MLNFTAAQQKFWLIARLNDSALTMNDLLEATLAIAWAEYPCIDLAFYRDRLDHFTTDLKSLLSEVSYPMKQVQLLNQYLFSQQKFQGNKSDYYDPRNSLITDVIDSRLGIPISLSVLYLILSDRLQIPFDGINFPGHFLIRPRSPELEILVDPFYGGEILFIEDCAQRLSQIYGQNITFQPEYLEPIGVRSILQRMLMNLKVIYLQKHEYARALRMVQWILILAPDAILQIKDRGLLCYQMGYLVEAKADLEQYVQICPGASDTETIKRIIKQI